MSSKKRILVAPLNWGLGHATRSIPIINALIEQDFEPIIASDGHALVLLKKEFPELICLELPAYEIEYPSNRKSIKFKLIRQIPKILKAIRAENKIIRSIVKKYEIKGIISDNRFGVYHGEVPSVYMTHQLKVLSGTTTNISTRMHHYIINKYDECWIPDLKDEPSLSGQLGHLKHVPIPIKYLGIISRFKKQPLPIVYDLLVLISGPEPQRTILEVLLMDRLKPYKGKVLFVMGKVEKEQSVTHNGNFTIYNFMLAKELEKAINESALVLSRSGYSTVLDMAKLEKNAFFIPTPGQFEQEYIAKRLREKGMIASCKQEDFKVDLLKTVNNYLGFKSGGFDPDYKDLFRLFEGK